MAAPHARISYHPELAPGRAGQGRTGRAKNISRINLRIGRLSGYVPEAVELNFQMASAGTKAQGALLAIEWVPLACTCKTVRQQLRGARRRFSCPSCRAADFTITGGREMFIESMEVDA